MKKSDLLLHPVRMRIVQALLGDRELTTAQLQGELPDVPAATLYRQVAALLNGGALEVTNERRVRGTYERTYRLRPENTHIGPEDAAAMTPEAGPDITVFTAASATIDAETVPPLPCITSRSRPKPRDFSSPARREM